MVDRAEEVIKPPSELCIFACRHRRHRRHLSALVGGCGGRSADSRRHLSKEMSALSAPPPAQRPCCSCMTFLGRSQPDVLLATEFPDHNDLFLHGGLDSPTAGEGLGVLSLPFGFPVRRP